MAPTVSASALEVESGLTDPGWYRWESPADGRRWAARTTTPATLLSVPMIVSADSDEELDQALANAERT